MDRPDSAAYADQAAFIGRSALPKADIARRFRRRFLSSQDKFFQELEDSVDGFGVIAEHFGRGMLNNVQAKRQQQQQP